MLHAKIMTVDGIVVNVGSAVNLNARSTKLDEESQLGPRTRSAISRRFSTASSTTILTAACG